MSVRRGSRWLAATFVLAGCVEPGPGRVDEKVSAELCRGPIDVPDPALRALLVELLPQPEPEEGQEESPPVVLGEALRELEGLRADGRGIEDLTGLECALALESIGIASNALSDLSPLAHLPVLREIEASVNRLESVESLRALPRLEKLALDDNGIRDIGPLADLVHLRYLDLGRNEVEDLSPLRGMRQLRSLVLTNNQVTSVEPLAELEQLVSVNLRGNAVTSIEPFENLHELRYVDLDDNEIQSVEPLAGATELREIRVSRNELRSLRGLENKPELVRIAANDNAIEDISAVAGLTRLTTLDLNGNRISALEGIDTLVGLRRLSVASNRLRSLESIAGLAQLRELDVRANPELTDISSLASLPLLGVFAAGEQALDLGPLADRPVLQRLTFTDATLVGDLGFMTTLPALTVVNLDGTALRPSDLEQLADVPSLRTLRLSNTGIDSLAPLAPLASLEELHAEDNAVSSLGALALWLDLRVAKLAGNPIASLEGTQLLERLRDLDVSRSELDDVSALVMNRAFSTGDRLTATATHLGADHCADLQTLRDRLAVVETDVACDDGSP